jgi:superfamily II DNA or RNA helicase
MNQNRLNEMNLKYMETYSFDSNHLTYIYTYKDICILIDEDICSRKSVFDYSKYCEMQNKYIFEFKKIYRFNHIDESIYDEIEKWISLEPENISLEDNGGSFDEAHIDNTPLEDKFEKLFLEAYGKDAIKYLNKEFPISLNDGRNAFIDYVIETKTDKYAIEENGVNYHHPCKIGNEKYRKQLEKQNTLSLYGFKVYRFSTENILFRDQMVDNIKNYLGDKENFLENNVLKNTRQVKLYEHQENILEELKESREKGINTSLIVIPTGTGKSQIAIEDLKRLDNKDIKNVLIMVPSKQIQLDWFNRILELEGRFNVFVKLYNSVYLERNVLEKEFYDYIVFDEAHHAQAANCKKTLAYFTPKYLIGLTATDERLDKQKLEEIFGSYECKLTLKEAIEKDIISNIRCYRVKSNIDLSHIRYNGKDYNYSDLERNLVIDSRNELIVETLKKYFSPKEDFYKQGIVFCINVDHCKKLERMLNDAGVSAKAIYGRNKDSDLYVKQFKNKEFQFLLSCQMISEGWDCPQIEIVVMARPTLSKILYVQQIGRGVRKYPGKECLFVIDVVDNYDAKLTPWNFNSLFHIPTYSAFMGVKDNNFDYLSILGLSEHEVAMEEVDIYSFEEKYPNYKSLEETARDLYIGTYTLSKWVKDNNSLASLYLPIGSRMMPYFNEKDIENIRSLKKLAVHNDETILKDFVDFIDENTLTFSFKLIFILGMLNLCDEEGEVNLDKLLDYYISFYKDRLDRNLPVDKPNCVYTKEYLGDRTKMKKSLLDNPFEKFERKRFVYYSERNKDKKEKDYIDLNILAFNPKLYENITKELKKELINKLEGFLSDYYKNLGGL